MEERPAHFNLVDIGQMGARNIAGLVEYREGVIASVTYFVLLEGYRNAHP